MAGRVKQTEKYALDNLRALILRALETDVEGSFEHEDGSNEFLVEHDAPDVCYIPVKIRLEVVR